MRELNHKLMDQAIQCLIGCHDFSAFRSSQCQSKQPIKTIIHAAVKRNGDIITIELRASGFLHHMIRNIAGSLIAIGKGEQPVSWMNEVLLSKDRCQAGTTATPNGLRFMHAEYPEKFDLPNRICL